MKIGAGFDRMSGMRKRFVIGVIVALVIGVGLKLLLQGHLKPKEGTVAWHKVEYFAERFPVTWWDRVRSKSEGLLGRQPSKNLALLELGARDGRQHVRALEELGYFQCRGVKLPYSPFPNAPQLRLWKKAQERLPKSHIWWIEPIEEPVDGYCAVLYEPKDAAAWDKIISEVKSETK